MQHCHNLAAKLALSANVFEIDRFSLYCRRSGTAATCAAALPVTAARPRMKLLVL